MFFSLLLSLYLHMYLWKVWRITVGFHLALYLVSAGLDRHPSHVEPEREQAFLALENRNN